MKSINSHLKIGVLVLSILMMFSIGVAQEKRFSFEVELYENDSEPAVSSEIVDSRQITPFMGTGDYNFTLESGNNLIDSGRMPVGFDVKGPTEDGEPYTDSVSSKVIQMYFPYNERVQTFNVYRNNEKIKEVNLTRSICSESPCEQYCWDVVDNSTLQSCENYEGFNKTKEKDGEKEGKSNLINLILIAALISLFLSGLYLKRER